MIILGIETSCDETAAAVLEQENGRIQILSNIVASSASMQSKYGGIIPEQAAREQLKSIIPVIEEALEIAHKKPEELDAIAVTYGPGLIGSLLVGVETAKVLAKIWDKPLIPVNHLIGHFYANWIDVGKSVDQYISKSANAEADIPIYRYTEPQFPCLGLLVSGGHTELVLFKDHNEFEYLGGTRDDAAGECFDKCARLLNLPYPGGPQISKLAKDGNPKAYNLPRPMLDSKDFDFSFSGLKTAVFNLLLSRGGDKRGAPSSARSPQTRTSDGAVSRQDPEHNLADLCASIEEAIIETIITKTVRAAQMYNVEQIIVAGGVAANQKLVKDLRDKIEGIGIKLFVPGPKLCTDNGAMIASAAFFIEPTKDLSSIQANPNLSLAY